MIEQLIDRAKEIKAETEANISGALIQVADELSITQCETFFAEWAGDDTKKVKRFSKKVDRVKDENNRYFTIHSLCQDICNLLESSRDPRSDKNHFWFD
jgi:hypothetical protein